MFPIAIDFGRFSGRSQEFGDSKRRQKSLADAWAERTGIPIDLRLCEEGVSGFQRQKRRSLLRPRLVVFVEQPKEPRPGRGVPPRVEKSPRLRVER